MNRGYLFRLAPRFSDFYQFVFALSLFETDQTKLASWIRRKVLIRYGFESGSTL